MHKVNNIRRFLATAAVLSSLFVIATIAYRMQHEASPKKGVRKLPLQVDVSLQKFRYTETSQGVKRWDLTADRAEYNKQKDMTSLTGVRLTVAGAKEIGELHVAADRADYNNATRDVTMSGNVHGQSSKGLEFSAPRVTYLAAKSLLQSSERVQLKDAGLELDGIGMEFQTQSRRFKLLKDVNAVYRPQGVR
jgi:LPS export ABC transporter protein LptC